MFEIKIGLGSCGIAAGAKKVEAALITEATANNIEINFKKTGCIGMCFVEPMIELIDETGKKFVYCNLDEAAAKAIINLHVMEGKPVENKLLTAENEAFLTQQTRIALRNCGIIDPENIEEYINTQGYTGLKKAIDLGSEAIIETIKASGLAGRGGAGFPTWIKWNAARNNQGETKYVICNADEGDPGAFMDRSLLESDPHSVIEGMIIAAYAIGAEEGVIYVRAEYPLSIYRLNIAIKEAEAKGFLGKNILNSGFNFNLRIKAGAGAFVCGEETALIASLEGNRGMPRIKPPFPAEKGYNDQPSNINNVETYANVPFILANGAEAYNIHGTEGNRGTKVFALAGKIKRGGLVEVPLGKTIREVVFNIGGGMVNDATCKGVQMGGPSGGCIPVHLFDTPIEYKAIAATGAIMGSGGMIAMDESTCMVDMARFFLDFTQKESCGKCVHCRIGTKRMLEILERITAGEGEAGDIEKLQTLGEEIIAGSLCGLGASAPNPALSTIRFFRSEYESHINDKKCPALNCQPLLTYTVNNNCIGCGACNRKCPVNAISGERKAKQLIDQTLCTKCGNCADVCRFNAITIE